MLRFSITGKHPASYRLTKQSTAAIIPFKGKWVFELGNVRK
jgi:hypothetical protein